MSAAAKRKGERVIEGFDEAKLAELEEPISVTVHKDQQGLPMPVTLPMRPGTEGAGMGYSRNDVRDLNEFLPNDWSGGGRYTIKALGDNGVEMKWLAFFPIKDYPEKIPPTMRNAASPAALAASGLSTAAPTPPTTQTTQMPQSSWMSQAAASSYPQQVNPTMTQLPATPFSPQNGYQGGLAAGGGYQGGYAGGGYQGGPSSAEVEIRKEREERLKMEARLERQAIESAYKERQSALEQEIRLMRETFQQASSRPAENAELTTLRAELERERQQREQDKAESRFQTQILEMQRQNDLRASEQQRQMEALVAKLSEKPSGPDPMMLMFMEMQKQSAMQQAEAMKESARAQIEVAKMQAEAQRESQRNAIGPREIMEIVGKTSGNQEQSINAMGRAWEFMQNAMEVAMQAQGGGAVHPAVQMIGEGLQGGLQLAQQYIQMKGQGQTTQARAAVAIEQARAQAAVQAGQLAGAHVPEAEPEEEEESPEDAAERHAAEILAKETELFGPALESVQRMRVGVASGALDPAGAANALVVGVEQAGKSGLKIPAFELWLRKEWSQLVDILIPDAPTSYKEQMLQAMHAQVEATNQAARARKG